MKKIKSLFAVLLSILILAPSFAFAADNPVFIRGVRPLGMGGAFVAIADDQNAFFYNPAGITQRQGSMFTLFELPVSISNDSLDFYNYYNDNKDALQNFDKQTLLKKQQIINDITTTVTKYRTEVLLGFPNVSYLSSGQQSVAWGFGVFDQADLGFQFKPGIIIPNLNYFGNVDAVAALPLAHRFDSLPYDVPGKLSVGANLKYIARAAVNETKSVLELDNISIDTQLGRGYGLDLGTLYQPNTRWNFGLQITDLGGTSISYDAFNATSTQPGKDAYTSMIYSQWNLGAAYIPTKIYYWPGKYIHSKDRIIFAADIRNVLSSDERVFSDYFWTKLHLGAELRWGPLSLRGGFNQGYPTFGVGARIPYLGLRLDYAYWSDELGSFAGQIPETRHQITIAMSWGDAKGRAYGSDVKYEEEKPKEAPKKEEAKPLTPSTSSQTVPVQPQMSQPALPAGTQVAPAAPAAPAVAAPAPAAAAEQPAVKPAEVPAKAEVKAAAPAAAPEAAKKASPKAKKKAKKAAPQQPKAVQ